MRILVVTSQFPIAGEPTRGRPILQTVRELAKLAEVRVLSPVARYPRWARPRSYLYQAPVAAETSRGIDVEFASYPALPMLSRPLNGWLCARALLEQARAFKPDLILSCLIVVAGPSQTKQLALPGDAELSVSRLNEGSKVVLKGGQIFFSTSPTPS